MLLLCLVVACIPCHGVFASSGSFTTAIKALILASSVTNLDSGKCMSIRHCHNIPHGSWSFYPLWLWWSLTRTVPLISHVAFCDCHILYVFVWESVLWLTWLPWMQCFLLRLLRTDFFKKGVFDLEFIHSTVFFSLFMLLKRTMILSFSRKIRNAFVFVASFQVVCQFLISLGHTVIIHGDWSTEKKTLI